MSRYLDSLLGTFGLFVVGFTLATPTDTFAQLPSTPSTPAVPVKVTNTPTVTVDNTASNPLPIAGTVQVAGTPTVVVANQPVSGTLYYEVLGVQISVNGSAVGAPGLPVPAGKRRIVTTVSARWACTAGHGALVQIFGNTGLFLPGQRAYTDSLGRDTYAMVSQVNISQGPGTQWVPIIESDGSTCLADIFVSGIEVPDRP